MPARTDKFSKLTNLLISLLNSPREMFVRNSKRRFLEVLEKPVRSLPEVGEEPVKRAGKKLMRSHRVISKKSDLVRCCEMISLRCLAVSADEVHRFMW